MKVNYLEDGDEWSDYLEAIQGSVAGTRDSVTWNDRRFGLRSADQTVKGSIDLYSYYNETAKETYLDTLLSAEIPGYRQSFRDLLRDYMITLYIEPGRALLDCAGLTAATVTQVSTTTDDQILVGLDMNRSNINPKGWELMTDPVLLTGGESREPSEDGVFFAGNLCLETDMITRHKTYLDQRPEPGDTVVFVNTAAYHMDFGESATIQHPVAEKIAVFGDRSWKQDAQYTGYEDTA